jgi:hypothetical protein
MRFVLLTLFSTLSGPMMTALFLRTTALQQPTEIMLKIVGLLLVLVFGVMDRWASDYWSAFWRRALELETKLNYSQYKARPHKRLLSVSNATRFLYLSMLLFWIIALIKPDWV